MMDQFIYQWSPVRQGWRLLWVYDTGVAMVRFVPDV